MEMQRLQEEFQEQQENNGKIVVSEESIQAAKLNPVEPFDGLLKEALRLDSHLEVETESIPEPDENRLTIEGKTSFLNLDSISIRLEFSFNSKNEVELQFETDLDEDWQFVKSFPSLDHYPFDALSLDQSGFVFSTSDQPSYSWKTHSIVLQPGLNFSSLLKVLGKLEQIQALLPQSLKETALVLSGPVDPSVIEDEEADGPNMMLSAPLEAQVQLPPFAVHHPRFGLEHHTNEEGKQTCWLTFTVSLKIGQSLELDFKAVLFHNSRNTVFAILPSQGTRISAKDVVDLLGGQLFEEAIPEVLKDVFKKITLNGFVAGLRLPETSTDLRFKHLSIDIGAFEGWSLGGFTLNNLDMIYSVKQPFDEQAFSLATFQAEFEFYPQVFQGVFKVEISADDAGGLSIGAGYQGEVTINDVVAAISSNLIIIPEDLVKMRFYDFAILFVKNGEDYDYNFFGNTDLSFELPFVGVEVESDFHLVIQSVQHVKTYGLKGGIAIGDVYFSAQLDLGGKNDEQLLRASWKAAEGEEVGINDLIDALSLPLLRIPEEIDLALVAASFAYDMKNDVVVFQAESKHYGKANFVIRKDPNSNYQYFSGLAVGEIDLTNLPLVNKIFDEQHRLAIEHIQIVLVSEAIEKQEVESINRLIEDGYPKVGAEGMPSGVRISLDLNLGGLVIPLSLSTYSEPLVNATLENAALENAVRPAVPVASQSEIDGMPVRVGKKGASSEHEGEEASDGTIWFDIQQKFGPVLFQKIGIKYDAGRIWFVLNTSLSASGLTLELLELSVGSPLKQFHPSFALDGIGMDYHNKSFAIGGTLLEIPRPVGSWEYGGGAVLKASSFSLQGMGSYAENKDFVSLFVFVQMNSPFGGPPCFFVNGILGGFGFNSQLRIPDLEELDKLPLISGLNDPSKIGGEQASPMQALEKLLGQGKDPAWITPDAGNVWIAAGLQFSTYELIQSTALMVGQFGNKFSLAVLGISKARFPKTGNTVYAYIEMDLRAYFAPEDGEISFAAVLSPSSFVLDPACQVTGGFAMFFWFGDNEHAGDFVVTVGGYSPFFRAPPWYPKIPRIGVNWSVDSYIGITGNSYFAMTPCAVMAGGSLDIRFEAGPVSAWMTANADIVIWWNPFYFILDIGVRVGARLRFGSDHSSKGIKVEVGCKLGFWGPPTGGHVKVKLLFITITISFGTKRIRGADILTWPEFVAILPQKQDAVKIVPVDGLTPEPAANGDSEPASALASARSSAPASAAAVLGATSTHSADEPESTTEKKPWLVRSDSLEFVTEACFPCTELFLGEDDDEAFEHNSKRLDIRPMGKIGLDSHQRLIVQRLNLDGDWETVKFGEEGKTWTIEKRTQNVANALWGIGSVEELSPGDEQMIENQLTGFRVLAPVPVLGFGPGAIDVKKHLSYLPLPPGKNPLLEGLEPSGPKPEKNPQAVLQITDVMGEVAETRNHLHGALEGLLAKPIRNDDLSEFAEAANTLFINEPLTI